MSKDVAYYTRGKVPTGTLSADAFYVGETSSSSHSAEGKLYTNTRRAAWLTSNPSNKKKFRSGRKLDDWIEQVTKQR